MVKTSDIVLVLVTVLFPPATAAILTGCSCDLLINILLTILGYVPGHIHGFWLIWKRAQAEERYGLEGFRYIGNGTYEPIGKPNPGVNPPSYGATA